MLADLLQGVVAGHLDAKAHPQNLGLARRQAVQNIFHHITQTGLHGGLHGSGVGAVLDEVAQVGVVIVANRSLHGDRLFGDLHDLADLVFRDLHPGRQHAGIGLKAELLQMLPADTVHLVDGLDHVHRNADGAGLIGNRAGDGLANPPGGIGGELVAAAVLKFVNRFHQADVALLDQVEKLQTAVGVFFSNRDDQAQVGLDHFFFGRARR